MFRDENSLLLQPGELALPQRRGPARRLSSCCREEKAWVTRRGRWPARPGRAPSAVTRPGASRRRRRLLLPGRRRLRSQRRPRLRPRPPPPRRSQARVPLPQAEPGEPDKSPSARRVGAAGAWLRLAWPGPARVRLSPRSPPPPPRVSALGSGTGRLSLGRAVTSPGHRLRRRLPEVSLRTAGHARRAHTHRAPGASPRTRAASRPASFSARRDAAFEHPRLCPAPRGLAYARETPPSRTHSNRPHGPPAPWPKLALQPPSRCPSGRVLTPTGHTRHHPAAPRTRRPCTEPVRPQAHSTFRPTLRVRVSRAHPPHTPKLAPSRSAAASPAPLSPGVRNGPCRPPADHPAVLLIKDCFSFLLFDWMGPAGDTIGRLQSGPHLGRPLGRRLP